MSSIKDHLAYLKDNPNGYWFKRKLYGWGWVPVTWEGWTALIFYIAGVSYFAIRFENIAPGQLPTVVQSSPIIILTLGLIALCYSKGEKPKWQWGPPKKKE